MFALVREGRHRRERGGDRVYPFMSSSNKPFDAMSKKEHRRRIQNIK